MNINGNIGGNISGAQNVRGNISGARDLGGNVNPIGQTIIQNAVWGEIVGDIENQDDLQIELHERDNKGMTVQEIERILYVG